MAKFRIVGTAGRDKIDLTGREKGLDPRFDDLELIEFNVPAEYATVDLPREPPAG